MSHRIHIRRLDAATARSALPALCGLLADSVRTGASVGFLLPFTAASAEPFWQGVIAAVAAGEVTLLVAEREGEILGTVQIALKQPPNQPHRGDLRKLLVHSAHRGQGLARQLMSAAEDAARAAGKTLLVLDTATGEPAEAIYERLGWIRSGVIPNYALFPDGRPCDTTIFFKALAHEATA